VGLNHLHYGCLGFSRRLPDPPCDFVHGLCRFLKNRDQERLLVLKVAIEPGTGDPGASRDHLYGDCIVGVMQEEFSGDRYQLLAPPVPGRALDLQWLGAYPMSERRG